MARWRAKDEEGRWKFKVAVGHVTKVRGCRGGGKLGRSSDQV